MFNENLLCSLAWNEETIAPFTLWHYHTRDTDVVEPGYFDEAAGILHVGDFIICNMSIAEATPLNGILVVVGDADGKVEVRGCSVEGHRRPPDLPRMSRGEWTKVTVFLAACAVVAMVIAGLLIGLRMKGIV